MYSYKKIILTLCTLIFIGSAFGQGSLKPGFDPVQYLQMLQLFKEQNAGLYPQRPQVDSTEQFIIPAPTNYTLLYRSPDIGLYNQWDMWLKDDSSLAVISIRGTIMKPESCLENFYAAMTPATGTIILNDSTTFHYQLAKNKRATVHTGWLIGMASLAPSIVSEIQKCEHLGVRQFIIFGHSQGGAIAFLLRSYLQYLPDSIISKEDVFKTYCSAAPKPGNLYYAYDFDYITRGGWGFRIVNEEDWVPETPFSLQTLQDFNKVNPFQNIKPALKKSNFFIRLYAGHLYNKLNRSAKRSERKFRKTLANKVSMIIKKTLPQLKEPTYAHTMNYMTAGTPVILMAYPGYDKDFTFDGKNYFIHHDLKPYYQLVMHDYINISDTLKK